MPLCSKAVVISAQKSHVLKSSFVRSLLDLAWIQLSRRIIKKVQRSARGVGQLPTYCRPNELLMSKFKKWERSDVRERISKVSITHTHTWVPSTCFPVSCSRPVVTSLDSFAAARAPRAPPKYQVPLGVSFDALWAPNVWLVDRWFFCIFASFCRHFSTASTRFFWLFQSC